MDFISHFFMNHMVDPISGIVLPIMLLAFFFGVVARVMIYYVSHIENRFTHEFDKRVRYYFATGAAPKVNSFYRLTRILLEKTFQDCFEKREKYKRRKWDHVESFFDRTFLVQDGFRRLIDESLQHIRYFRKDGQTPKMIETSKTVFENNAYFNRVMGVIPTGLLHDLLNALPGLFLIGGILGTFLGIAKGLPELGAMDLANMDASKHVMDGFLAKISMAMVKSIVGIGLSVVMGLFNTFFSIEGVYYTFVNRYSGTLEYIWNETTTNEVDQDAPPAANQDMRVA